MKSLDKLKSKQKMQYLRAAYSRTSSGLFKNDCLLKKIHHIIGNKTR